MERSGGSGGERVLCVVGSRGVAGSPRRRCEFSVESGYTAVMSDEQDVAESVDEEMVGTDAVTSDEVGSFGDHAISEGFRSFTCPWVCHQRGFRFRSESITRVFG